MILLDVIEYNDPIGNTIIKKVPEDGSANIRFGGQLIVRETQVAVFYKDGKALDIFNPGRHTLTTNNLPLLSELLASITRDKKTIFTSEVYFVNQKTFTDLKWGTPQPIDLKDPEFGWIQIRSFGTFSIKISDPQLFINNLVGTKGVYSQEELNKFLKGSILTNLNTLFANTFKGYSEVRKDLEAFATAMKFAVKDTFDKYGIELRDFFVMDISVPEEIQEALRTKTRMNILGVNNYTHLQTAEAIGNMGNSSHSSPMETMAGMGLGMMMPQMMAQSMQSNAVSLPQQTVNCYKCNAPVPDGSRFCPACGASALPPSQQTVNCYKCNAPILEGSKFCSACGASQEKSSCIKCKNPLSPGMKFCPNCGESQG